jgi:serine/threonine protein kinase/Tol biopolymer transport system component
MSLTAGARLGPYEIVAPLGAGGMGEVYRAKDGRLNRTVAIKVLPTDAAGNADRRERFEREAKAISALDHPNICVLYDVGEHDGTYFLVMPCLEGQTLAERLAKGALPPDQAIKIGIEIATALDAAHRHGIVHRDLKPGNVMLTKAGVKLLDFGLAKLTKAGAPTGLADTTQAIRTGMGVLLGTMPYMAPEQIEGRDVDTRSDIFALGAVLYEMLTGERAFKGDSSASVIGAILKDTPPPIRSRQPLAPPALEHVVFICLAKDPDERWQSAADIARELKWVAESASADSTTAVPARRRSWMPATAGVIAGAAIVAALAWPAWRTTQPSGEVMRFAVVPEPGTTFVTSRNSLGVAQFAVSPNGRMLAFVAAEPDQDSTLWVRAMNDITPRKLAGTVGALDPFWSPDSQLVGFFAGGRLKTIHIGTGEIRDLCPASRSPRGGAWSPSGVILFGGDSGSGFSKVIVSTGVVEAATETTVHSSSHRWPDFLPDGRRFLFYARGDKDHRGIYVGSLDGDEPIRIIEGMFAGRYSSGHLLTLREGALLAYPFDERAARITGDPIQIALRVAGSSTQQGAFSLSSTGTLVYSGGVNELHRMWWFDRAGKQTPTHVEPAGIVAFRLSPDGTLAALSRVDATLNTTDIWIADFERASTMRLTLDPSNDIAGAWSRDGKRLVFRSDRTGDNFLYGQAAGGGGDEQLTNFSAANPTDWTADGRSIVFHQTFAATNSDIGLASLQEGGAQTILIKTAYDEYEPRLSPDGKWIAYVSDESGRPEVYVQTFPISGRKWTISTAGGNEPRWRGDGRELFYLANDGNVMSVSIESNGTFRARPPQALFQTTARPSRNPYHMVMDAAPDGQRFLVKLLTQGANSSLTAVLNWTSLIQPQTAR